MLTVSTRVLSLSAEAALLVRGGRIVFANTRAEALLGAKIAGKTLASVFPPEIAEAQARSFTADTVVDGKTLNVRTARVDDMQAFFLSEIDTRPALLNDAFLYSMRSALMNLRLSAELCRAQAETSGDAVMEEKLRAIQRSAFSLSRLLDNAAVVRGIAAGDLTAHREPMDLAGLCRRIFESVSLLRQDIRFRIYAEGELCLLGDRVLIEQLIYNLISNCLIHAEGLSQITLSITPTPTQLILSVSDDGCGIDEDALGSVFERYREDFSLNDMDRGAGLGLSVVRGIARLHEGTLMLESRAGSGTSARVSLAQRLNAAKLSAPVPELLPDAGALLCGLAECLPEECFGGKYLD